VIGLAFGGALLLVRRRGLKPILVVLAFGTNLVFQPHLLISYPNTGSPNYAEFNARIHELVATDHRPIAFGLTGKAGYYEYPARTRFTNHTEWDALAADLAREGPRFLLIRQEFWNDWPRRPADARIVAETQVRRAQYSKDLNLYLVVFDDP
jgi:hypothetical protein